MSDPVRLTAFIARRLTEMGVPVALESGGLTAQGELALRPTPFPTLAEPLVAAKARFYTLDHRRLKFYAPAAFFDLAAVDVASCNTAREVEAALRKAWSARLTELKRARAWLEQLGAEPHVSGRGTRLWLPLTDPQVPPAYVKSPSEILIPSGGPLAKLSLQGPGARRHRPLRNLEHPSELELGLSEVMTKLGRERVQRRKAAASPASDLKLVHVPRLLLLDERPLDLAATQSALRAAGFDVDGFHEASRALDAFHERSYDLVVADTRMRRGDGLEFTARLQELAGIEKLPVVLVDPRANSAMERAAREAGASVYIPKPVSWGETGEMLGELVESVRQRRFVRFPARLSVETLGSGAPPELTSRVARGGFTLLSQRDVPSGLVERYRITLPPPLPSVIVDAAVVTYLSNPGRAAAALGARILAFRGSDELHWVRMIEELARRAAAKTRR